jgi:hypothetical protein
MVSDREILEAALLGFQAQLKEVEDKIAEIRAQLTGRSTVNRAPEPAPKKRAGRPKSAPAVEAPKKKRVMSPAARERIAEAQKRRWAAHHAQQEGSN